MQEGANRRKKKQQTGEQNTKWALWRGEKQGQKQW